MTGEKVDMVMKWLVRGSIAALLMLIGAFIDQSIYSPMLHRAWAEVDKVALDLDKCVRIATLYKAVARSHAEDLQECSVCQQELKTCIGVKQ